MGVDLPNFVTSVQNFTNITADAEESDESSCRTNQRTEWALFGDSAATTHRKEGHLQCIFGDGKLLVSGMGGDNAFRRAVLCITGGTRIRRARRECKV